MAGTQRNKLLFDNMDTIHPIVSYKLSLNLKGLKYTATVFSYDMVDGNYVESVHGQLTRSSLPLIHIAAKGFMRSIKRRRYLSQRNSV